MARRAISWSAHLPTDWFRSWGPVVLAGVLCAATAALIWSGQQSAARARAHARVLLERRVREQLALLWVGLTQDMKGAHATVVASMASGPTPESPYDLAETFARAFARFPYPESFFVWRADGPREGTTYVFHRADRLPSWDPDIRASDPYPVVTDRNPMAARALVADAFRGAAFGARSSVFAVRLDHAPYQVVVSYRYGSGATARLEELVGFTVNLDWVRFKYFDAFGQQIANIGGASSDIVLAVLDDMQRPVTPTRQTSTEIAPVERAFPLLFADRTLLGPPRERELPPVWTTRAAVAHDSLLLTSELGDRSRSILISFATATLLVSLILTARGVRAAADLARMKSDFVVSITHDLKTPLAVIRLLADTLAHGRYQSRESARTYASQLSRESGNLSKLIDHLLAYARLTDPRQAYDFGSVDVAELIDDAMEQFGLLLEERQFTTTVEVEPDLPPVWGDRSALVQALDNLIANAIQYSDTTRHIHVLATSDGAHVTISVADQGIGIGDDDIRRVTERFVRGKQSHTRGSGLGLAIVRQIMDAHRGSLRIDARVGQGTQVQMVLPVAAVA